MALEGALAGWPAIGAEAAIPAGAALGAARALGLLTIFPLFSLFSILGILRIGLALGLSAPSVFKAQAFIAAGGVSWLEWAGLGLKEFAFGSLIGAALGIPFWAAQAAGAMVDVYRGANAANLFDQVNALETTPLGSILMAVALAVFVAAGGVVDLIGIFYQSFAVWPFAAFVPVFGDGMRTALLDVFGSLVTTGLLLAAPFLIVTGAVELSLAFIARSAKQFPLNDNLTTFKNLAVVILLVVYAMFATSYFGDAWQQGFGAMRSLFEALVGLR